MRILVINPNTTAAMTSDIEAQARRYAHPFWSSGGVGAEQAGDRQRNAATRLLRT